MVGEAVTVIILAKVKTWSQLSADATTRRHIPFTGVIIGFLGDDSKIDSMVASPCIFIEDKKSATGAACIIDEVSVLRDYVLILSQP